MESMSSSKISNIGSATVSQGGGASGGKKGKRWRRKNNRGRLSQNPIDPYEKNLKVTDKVLKSDEKLRALYEEWSLEFKPGRTAEDKEMRFEYFKQFAIRVRKLNQKYPTGGFGLNCFADKSDEELSKRGMIGVKQSDCPVKYLQPLVSFANGN